MGKSNVVVALICIVAAAVLSVLYVVLGFEQYDHALTFVIVGVWMLLLAALVFVVHGRENLRRKLIRRIYISSATLYNAEYGPIGKGYAAPTNSAQEFVAFAKNTLADLKYGFSVAKQPTGFDPEFVIESDVFKAKSDEAGSVTVSAWTGTLNRCVRDAKGQISLEAVAPFSAENQLAQVLRDAKVFA